MSLLDGHAFCVVQASVRIVAAITLLLFSFPCSAATLTVSNTNDSGAGSLRRAIIDANATVGEDRIEFSIERGTIRLLSCLPPITAPVRLFGKGVDPTPRRSFAPLIVIDGSSTSGCSGISVRDTTAVQIGGLSVINFDGSGIEFINVKKGESTPAALLSYSTAGEWFDGSRWVPAGNGGAGVRIEGSQEVFIQRVTSSDNARGLHIAGGSAHFVEESMFHANRGDGIMIAADEVTLGKLYSVCRITCYPDRPNVINGNAGAGIVVDGSRNSIFWNSIGVPIEDIGEANGSHGILIRAGSGNLIVNAEVIARDADAIRILGEAEVRESQLRATGGMRIDLGGDGPTPNDALDSDEGANGLLNSPELSLATSNGRRGYVDGQYHGAPGKRIAVEINPDSAPLDYYLEGSRWTFTVPASGTAVFRIPARFAPGDRLYAIASEVVDGSPPTRSSEVSEITATQAEWLDEANVTLSVTPLRSVVASGSEFTYRIDARNDGPAVVSEMLVEGIAPAGTTLVRTRGSSSCYSGYSATCVTGLLAPGQAVSWQVTLRVDASSGESLTSEIRAVVLGPTDPNLADNSARLAIGVTEPVEVPTFSETILMFLALAFIAVAAHRLR